MDIVWSHHVCSQGKYSVLYFHWWVLVHWKREFHFHCYISMLYCSLPWKFFSCFGVYIYKGAKEYQNFRYTVGFMHSLFVSSSSYISIFSVVKLLCHSFPLFLFLYFPGLPFCNEIPQCIPYFFLTSCFDWFSLLRDLPAKSWKDSFLGSACSIMTRKSALLTKTGEESYNGSSQLLRWWSQIILKTGLLA